MTTIDQQFTELSSAATANLERYTHYFNFNSLLRAYANYMQATQGDNTTAAPEPNVGKEYYKWRAWKSLEGKSVEDAKKDYVDILTNFNQELHECECIPEDIDNSDSGPAPIPPKLPETIGNGIIDPAPIPPELQEILGNGDKENA
jgi:diazepam-binding inhibitor (GABA receptor modulating acyl-CoA-binding protein)